MREQVCSQLSNIDAVEMESSMPEWKDPKLVPTSHAQATNYKWLGWVALCEYEGAVRRVSTSRIVCIHELCHACKHESMSISTWISWQAPRLSVREMGTSPSMSSPSLSANLHLPILPQSTGCPWLSKFVRKDQLSLTLQIRLRGPGRITAYDSRAQAYPMMWSKEMSAECKYSVISNITQMRSIVSMTLQHEDSL